MGGKSHEKFRARWQTFSPPPQEEVPPSNTAAWVPEASSDVCAPPAIAQLVEHLTVECCSNQMVPGSIPGGRIYRTLAYRANQCAPLPTSLHITSNRVVFVDAGYKRAGQFYQWVM